jgi:hypothetical protein
MYTVNRQYPNQVQGEMFYGNKKESRTEEGRREEGSSEEEGRSKESARQEKSGRKKEVVRNT